MEIKRSFEKLTVTKRRFVIRQTPAVEIMPCAECGSPVLTAEQTAKLFGITQRRIFRIIETNAAHFAETETGAMMICLNSLTMVLTTERR